MVGLEITKDTLHVMRSLFAVSNALLSGELGAGALAISLQAVTDLVYAVASVDGARIAQQTGIASWGRGALRQRLDVAIVAGAMRHAHPGHVMPPRTEILLVHFIPLHAFAGGSADGLAAAQGSIELRELHAGLRLLVRQQGVVLLAAAARIGHTLLGMRP